MARGRIRLSSTTSLHKSLDHLYGSVTSITSVGSSSSDHRVPSHAATQLIFHLCRRQSTSILPTAQLTGSIASPAVEWPRSGALASAQLDSAFHLSALPEARGTDGADCTPAAVMVPAGVQLYVGKHSVGFGNDSNPAPKQNLHASAAVQLATGTHTAINASFTLASSESLGHHSRVQGFSARQMIRPLFADHPLAEEEHSIMYSTEWQVHTPHTSAATFATINGAEYKLAASETALQCSEAIALIQHALREHDPSSVDLNISLESSFTAPSFPHPMPHTSSDALNCLLKSAAIELGAAIAFSNTQRESSHPAALNAPSLCISTSSSLNPNNAEPSQRISAGAMLNSRLTPSRQLAVLSQRANDSSVAHVVSGGKFLITGGLGSLGMITAGWLLVGGAEQVELTGRNARAVLSDVLTVSQNASVVITQCDISTATDCAWLSQGSRTLLTGNLHFTNSKS